jgi:hypothetical protein
LSQRDRYYVCGAAWQANATYFLGLAGWSGIRPQRAVLDYWEKFFAAFSLWVRLFRQFGLSGCSFKSGMREALQARQERLELAVLARGGSEDGAGLLSKAHIYGFAAGFVGPFPVGSVAFGGIYVTGASGLATLHSPLQHGSFAKVLQILQFLLQLAKALGVAVKG